MPTYLHSAPYYNLPTSAQIGTQISATEWNEAEKVMSHINGNGYMPFCATGQRMNGKVMPLIGSNGGFYAVAPFAISLSSFIAPGMNRFYGQVQWQYHINIALSIYLVVGGSEYRIFYMDKTTDNNYPVQTIQGNLGGKIGTTEIGGIIPSAFRAFGQSKTCYLKCEVDFTDNGTIAEGTAFTNPANYPFAVSSITAAVHGIKAVELWFYKDCSDEC